MQVQVLGVGHYLPETIITNDALSSLVNKTPEWIERTTGVIERRRVTTESTVDMAVAAIHDALTHARIRPDEIDTLISASAGRLQTIPCTAAFIHRQLALPVSTFAFDVDATCLGFLVALQVASTMVEQGQARHVVVVSSEVASGTIDYRQPESAVLFGDAAAAAVIGTAPPDCNSRILHSRFHTVSEGAELAQIRGGGTLRHPNFESTTPEMNLFQMQGKQIFKTATRYMQQFLDDFFESIPWKRSDVNTVVPHQASRMATLQLIKRYGFKPNQIVDNLKQRGNCVAASLPLAFSEAVHSGRISRGDRVLLVGTGAGLTLGAVAMEY